MIEDFLTPLPPELKMEVSESETLRVEFKKSYAEKREIQETMLAMANAVGGRIYVGVEEVHTNSGLRQGKVVGIAPTGMSKASDDIRNWCGSFRPPVDASLKSYEQDGRRVDVIEVRESTQKPVGSSAGLYKIRSSDGNTGIDPAVLREMIVGYNSYKWALVLECRENLLLLGKIRENLAASRIQLNDLRYSTADAILANAALTAFFDIGNLLLVRGLCVQINKVLDFAISAGGVVRPAEVFHDKLRELCPALESATTELLRKVHTKVVGGPQVEQR